MEFSDSVPLFSYGSNGRAQLEGRIKSPPEFVLQPATLEGYERIFAGYSKLWCGAIASIRPSVGSSVFGSIVRLTRTQLDELTRFEGGYELERVVCVYRDTGEQVDAWAFVKQNASYSTPPSEQYLTAIYHHHTEVWGNDDAESIAVVGISVEGERLVLDPFRLKCCMRRSIPSFLVSVNVRRVNSGRKSWQLPLVCHNL